LRGIRHMQTEGSKQGLLSELPLPPPGKRGWPWMSENRPPAAESDWPRITVVTPSYNQGQFLEETIRSVLLQGYTNLEFIIIDGGSSDGTADIIQKYAHWLDYWVSEPDRGQGHAINKGFGVATGNIVAWLNSDDLYEPGALWSVALAYKLAPDTIVAGNVVNFGPAESQERLFVHRNITLDSVVKFWEGRTWHQPGLFFPSKALQKAGPIDENLRYAMDYDLLCRLLQHTTVTYLSGSVTRFRIHATSKTTEQAGVGFLLENTTVSRRYWNLLSGQDRADCEHGLTRRLVRRAARQALRARIAPCLALLKTSWNVSRKQTVRNLLMEAAQVGRMRESV
jgi:glycosyltransferase involved in cell wall biosynthesis